MAWTRFMDMHSGGGTKEGDYEHIYIEAPEEEAKLVFQNRFGHNPNRVTCTCCGPDYSISEEESLEQATGYERGCNYEDGQYVERKSGESWAADYQTLAQYKAESIKAHFIEAKDIKPEERVGELLEQGYVWKD